MDKITNNRVFIYVSDSQSERTILLGTLEHLKKALGDKGMIRGLYLQYNYSKFKYSKRNIYFVKI